MSGHTHTGERGRRVRMPSDVDAPDKVVYGLTFRQLAILAVAATAFYLAWKGLHTLLPVGVLAGAGIVVGGVVTGLTLGRRDGLSMDVWLLAALRHRHRPKAYASTAVREQAVPDWVRTPPGTARAPLPSALRLPASAIDSDGHIQLSGTGAAMLAATNINLALRTGDEQAALVDAFGRWLNSLSTPTQIVVSTQPVDVARHARALARRARHLPDPALEGACAEHARWLSQLAEHRDPLRRQVLILTTAAPGEGAHGARRRADDTARALSGLGVAARALDGAAVSAALAATADPYRPARPGGLATADTVITARPGTRRRRQR